jgi:hypothetical protein
MSEEEFVIVKRSELTDRTQLARNVITRLRLLYPHLSSRSSLSQEVTPLQ